MDQKPDAPQPAPEAEAPHRRGNMFLLEICFLAFIGIVVVLAFLEALSYKLVSSRTPFVIMVPLGILIVIHGLRLWRIRGEFHPAVRMREALAGANVQLNKVLGISAWMIAMVLMILVFGHYAGIFLFCVIMMRFVADEKLVFSVVIAAITTALIFGVFEYLFNIDLYRGLIVRYFLGFRDF